MDVRRRRTTGLVPAIAVLVVVAAACASSSTTTAGSGAGSSSSPSFTTLKPGQLQVGSCLDYPPFESVPKGSTKPTGFDIDLTEAIAAKLGLQVAWVKANFGTIFTAVAAHKFDMVAAAVTATGKLGAQRAQTVAFSDFYYNSEQSLTVNTSKTPDIKTTADLTSGDIVGVQQGTTGSDWAQTNLQPKGVQIKVYPDAPQAFTDLEAGNITGVINDAPSSAQEVKSRPTLSVVEEINTHEQYAFAFAPDNQALVNAWNGGLKSVIADGTYQKIFQKYFPGVPVPSNFQPTGA